MKYVLLSLFASVWMIQMLAQTGKITGKITDDSGEPLYGATVLYKNDITLGAVADDQGNYILELPVGECILIYRFTGKSSDTLIIRLESGDLLQQNVVLHDPVIELKTVEYKVGKFDKPLEEQTVSMEVLKPELIEAKNTRSIETILDQTPGLNILDGEPQIRGGSGFTFGVGAKVAVIVDDMPMMSGDAGRPEWGFVPVENITQVEVTKGAASVLSGSSALSGSIHIRTAYPTDKPLTKINVYGGFYSKPAENGATWWNGFPGIGGMNFLHSRKIGNFDLVIGGNLNIDHGYIGPPVTDSIVATVLPDTVSNFTEKQLIAKKGRINFNLRYRSKRFRGLNYGVNGNFMLQHTTMPLAWLNDSSGIYRAYPGALFLQDQFIFNVDPFVNFYTQTNGKHSLKTRILHIDNQMSANQSNRSTTFYGDYTFSKAFPQFKNFDFIGGITSTFTSSYANIYAGSGSPENNLFNLSGYTQLEQKIKKTATISLGGRIEYFELNDSVTALKPIFRTGGNLKIYQETYLRASYGQGYRFPTITERFIKTGVGNFGVFPNPGLKPETSWNAEVGIKQGLKFGKLMGYLDIAGFWQEYKNTIEYMFGIWHEMNSIHDMGSSAGFMFMNTGKSRVLGVDISFSGMAKISKNVEMTFLAGYNYILPKTLSPDYVYAVDSLNRVFSYNSTSLNPSGRILKYRFLHNLKIDAEATFYKKIGVGLSVKYYSKIVNMDAIIKDFEDFTKDVDVLQDLQYMDYYYAHNHGNWIFDSRISYKLNEKHKLALVGSNIFNKVYSLRPLKIESPRTIMLQYTFKIQQDKKHKKNVETGNEM